MSRIAYCAFCGEPMKEQPCESCGADEEKIHHEMLVREGLVRAEDAEHEGRGES